MNVWPETHIAGQPALVGSEGELESVSIAVAPRLLERLLEALAGLPFPVNPEIHHSGPRRATLVEFPAYEARLPDIRDAVTAAGCEPSSVRVRNMLEQIHRDVNWSNDLCRHGL